jgi:hypothetical protein
MSLKIKVLAASRARVLVRAAGDAEGPGWISRLLDAVAKGAVLPGLAVALMSQPIQLGR